MIDPDGWCQRGEIGKPAWTLEQVECLVEEAIRPQEEGPFGLPKKDTYTSADVCQILGGITHERLRYLIETGAAPDAVERDKNGHRVWTEGRSWPWPWLHTSHRLTE